MTAASGPKPVDLAKLQPEELAGLGELAISAGVQLTDFWAHMPSHQYIFAPSREFWPASSVNSRLPAVEHGGAKMTAAAWLDRNRAVEQVTWAPGQPMTIEDRLIADGGWIARPGCRTFNLYRPPILQGSGDAAKASPWLEHVTRIYADEANHIIDWLAHRVQRPHEMINHALVLGGCQGIGKDTLLEPVKHAIGPWNFAEVSPSHMLGRFNGFVKSVILRVSEARDLGEVNGDRFAFYDHMKTYTAAPPDVLRVDEKHAREYSVFNVCGVIITTNHKSDGIFLPADDRRHFVAWSALTREDFTQAYWQQLWRWYRDGGNAHVAAHLRTRDLSDFDPSAPPRKTEAFWHIVSSNRAPEDDELSDALEKLGHPAVLTVGDLKECADLTFRDWLGDRRNARRIPHRLEEAGYQAARNPGQEDGRWKVDGKNVPIYARRELSVRDAIAAADLFLRRRRP
jgi:hypothetical protein